MAAKSPIRCYSGNAVPRQSNEPESEWRGSSKHANRCDWRREPGGPAGKWAGAGHEVKVGVRDPEAARARGLVNEAGTKIETQTMASPLPGADVVLFAIPGAAMAETIRSLASELPGRS